ncbi:hypothetical protein [Nocardioides zhouii]|uniref:WD40 repeat domain-containing protein n=1 Tax=Nocardioides zhouii TaxID=1168729 RepID=A0A4Q2SNV9_9ACTN|nr:hypothetical protein [Nocardioides zhouii]RYC05779.1 hypothetical protein EUA94_17070 [Nocardioides zhouii]
MSAVSAPTVDDAPVGRGMLLAQLNLFSTDDNAEAIRVGHPYLMTQTGKWRQFDLQRYGFGARAYGELSMALSRDGRRVALADPSGLVTVDLRDNTFRRFDVPGDLPVDVDHAVALEWSEDAATLFFKDRNGRGACGPKGCALDVTTGGLSKVPYNKFYATPGVVGETFEVQGANSSHPARVITHQVGIAPSVVNLDFRLFPTTGGGPAAASHLAFPQCSRNRRARDTSGVVVVDPSTGEVVAMLANERSGECHLGAQVWLTNRHLLVDDWRSGGLWLWDVHSERVVRVATSHTTGVNMKVAREVMAQRLQANLQ